MGAYAKGMTKAQAIGAKKETYKSKGITPKKKGIKKAKGSSI